MEMYKAASHPQSHSKPFYLTTNNFFEASHKIVPPLRFLHVRQSCRNADDVTSLSDIPFSSAVFLAYSQHVARPDAAVIRRVHVRTRRQQQGCNMQRFGGQRREQRRHACGITRID
jgi:hypothetical protein